MYDILGKNWWVLTVRGVAAVVFGILAFRWPGETILILITLFGAYAFVGGIFSLVAALRAAERHAHWVALLAEGILGVLVGVIAFFHPGSVALAFILLIAFWAIVTGALEIFAAFRLRRELEGEFLLGISGLASVVFGVLLLIVRPNQSLVALVWILGIYAMIFGILMIGLSLRLRSWQHDGGGKVRRSAEGPA